MKFSLITEANNSQLAFERVREAFADGADVYHQHKLGWPSGSGVFETYWHGRLGIWGVFEPHPPVSRDRPRFWFCFGVNDPADRSMLGITVEINPPHQGINNRLGGAFVTDSSGQLYLGHSGRVGGGRKGIGQRAFLEFFEGGNWHFVPGRRSQLHLIGPVDSADFVPGLARFIREVARFKVWVAR